MSELAAQFAVRRNMRREMGIESVDQIGAIELRDHFDKNKDGNLAPDEWAAANLPLDGKNFDQNEDRLLSISEIATMLAKRRMDLGLTVSDQKKLRQIFVLDFNRDRKISKEESESGVVFGGQPEDMSIYDADKNGDITVAEVEKFLAEQRKERGYNATHFTSAQNLILRLDRNRSKYLEEHEFAEEPGPGQLPAGKFSSIDLNNDERVGLDELARYLASKDE